VAHLESITLFLPSPPVHCKHTCLPIIRAQP
jgi:hypothetical protein